MYFTYYTKIWHSQKHCKLTHPKISNIDTYIRIFQSSLLKEKKYFYHILPKTCFVRKKKIFKLVLIYGLNVVKYTVKKFGPKSVVY